MTAHKAQTPVQPLFSRALADRITSTRQEELAPEAVQSAVFGLIDTIAVTLAGSREPASLLAARVAGTEAGPALVLGTQTRTSALNAALANGVAANVIDFDDCNDNLAGHPSAPVLSALLPLAESIGASGSDLLLAYIVGVEAETQIGKAVNYHHYEKGWHPTGTLGVFGAAAGCSKLLGLSPEQTATALAICTSLSCGIKANFGSMVKALHIGYAARNGMFAAMLAREGFNASADAFEHHHGFFNVFNGPGTYDAARALEKWGNPFDISFPGMAIKQYPCCLSVQSPIDATLRLVRARGIHPDDILSVRVQTAPRRLAHTNIESPRDDLEAKLSLQYCLARAAVNGQVRVEHFRDDAFRAPEIQAFMRRISPQGAANLQIGDALGAVVTIETRSGLTATESIDRPVGHEPGTPLPEHLLKQKFMGCMPGVLEPPAAERLYQLLCDVNNIKDVRTVTAQLA